MSKLNEVCGKLYAAEISTVNIDILKKEIRFDLIINDGQEKTAANRINGDASKDKILKKLKSNGFID